MSVKINLSFLLKNYRIVKISILPFLILPLSFYYFLLYFYFILNAKRKLRSNFFFHAQDDFGCILDNIVHIRCLLNSGMKVSLFVFTPNYERIGHLAQILCPDLHIIYPLDFLTKSLNKFFSFALKKFVYTRIFYRFIEKYPHAMFVYNVDYGKYLSSFDRFKVVMDSKNNDLEFQEAMNKNVATRNIRYDLYMQSFHSRESYKKIDLDKSSYFQLKKLIDFSRKIIILNINNKDYGNLVQNSRRIEIFSRYNILIDYLIKKDFFVVLQGSQEQPFFSQRQGFFDYAHCSFQSIKNDLFLFSKSYFFITSKSGSEIYGSLFNIPTLGLNYTELSAMNENKKFRFYPKHIKDNSGRYLTWKEYLKHPIYFQLGKMSPVSEAFSYEEMSEEELIKAVDEFILLIDRIDRQSTDWLNYTQAQKDFKQYLHPGHLDLYYISGVPCDSYLRLNK